MRNIKVGDKLAYVRDEYYSGWIEVTVKKISKAKWYTSRNWDIITVSNGKKFWENGDLHSNGCEDEKLMTIADAEKSQPYRDKNTNSRENSFEGWGMCGYGTYGS